jgi:hypothetical protein
MLIEQFSTAKETINSVQWRIQSAHREFEGAQVRLALARIDSIVSFLTGTMVFSEHEPESRGTADYGHIRLSEFWIKGVDAAYSFLGRLFDGKESVGGIPLRNLFKRSMTHRECGRHSASGWPSWIYETSAESVDGQQRLNLEPIPTVAKGLPPFKTPSEAVTAWMGQAPRSGVVSGNVNNQDQFVIVIPDTRARFKSCRWSPGYLTLDVELNTAPESVELQIIHGGAKSRSANHSIQPGTMSFHVPEDANDLALYLAHAGGELLSCQTLTQLYRSFGESEAQEEYDQSHWQDELQKGENERREFKPFIAPTDAKELEIVKTTVAFANTDGGTIFVGVDNEGVPIGVAQARKFFKSEDPIDAQMTRLKALIRECTQPVPSIACKKASVGGQPIIVVEIEKSETICSTHDNRAYVRRGATNRLADPRTELPSLSKTSNLDVWDNPLHSYVP